MPKRRSWTKVHKLDFGPCDATKLESAYQELVGFSRRLPPHAIERLADAIDVLRLDPANLIVSDRTIVPTGGTYKMVGFLKPSPAFLDLLSAMRAVERELNVPSVL